MGDKKKQGHQIQMKIQRTQNSQTNLEKEQRGFTFTNFKTSYVTTVTKMVWYRHR